ncbi:MAG: hypothetical protein AAF543_07570 [Pseudomonadota bacterium]
MPENAAAEGGFGQDAPDRSRDTDNDRGGAREDKESRAEKAESFDRAMDNANRPDRAPAGPSETADASDDDDDHRDTTDSSDDRTDRAAGPPGVGAPPSSTSAASDHANEFSGLGPSGGPIDNTLSGDDSRNSHRGYGPDDSLAGGIDDNVNAELTAARENHPANEFSGLGPSGGPVDDRLAGDIDQDVNAGLKDQQAARQTDAADLVGPAGQAAAGLQGGLEAYRDYVDRGSRHAAANTLTNGNAANLPGRADLSRTITDPRMTASKALDVTPYGPNAQSTQQLSTGAQAASKVGTYANRVGLGVQPAAGAIQGYVNTPENASWTERATNTVVGAVKEFDDTAVSYGAGLGAGTLTVAGSAFTGPAAPVVAGSAPAVGVGAAIYAGEQWNNGAADRLYDGLVDDYVRPGLEFTFETIDDYVVDPISNLFGDEGDDATGGN